MREYSPAFLRGVDYLGAMIIGASSLLLPRLLVPAGWGMAASMASGMALAMAAAFVVSILLSPLAAFEVVVPGMVISMTLGMFSPRLISDSFLNLALVGVLAGAATQLVFHVYDLSLHGEAGV